MYFSRFSIITQTFIAISTSAIGNPDGALIAGVNTIPINIGNIFIAPSALYLLVMKIILAYALE